MLLLACLASLPAVAHAQAPPPGGGATRGRLTKPPELLEFVEAEYPEAELAEGRSATVVLQIAIAADGTVEDAAVVESAGAAFDQAALAAVRQFKFSPAEIDGRPAPVKVTYRYEFTPRTVAPTTGHFRGVVLAKGTGEPLVGVTVEVEGVGSVLTNERGEFAFDELPPGEIRITLFRDDLTRIQTTETVEVGRTLEARYDIELPDPEAKGEEEADDFEVVVLAPRLVKQVVSTEVGAEEARRVPGTQGDVLKVVENLPGVARASAGSGEVVVWGAAPQDTRTYVGAVRIPMLYHFGGLRSVVHNDRVQSVQLIPGGYGSAYGRGLGGLVRVEQRDPASDRLRGSVQLDVLDASAALTAPVADQWSVAIVGRRSHVADLARLRDDSSYEEFFTLPQYHDGQARLRRELAPGEFVEIGGMLSGDVQKRTQPSDDPGRRVSERRTLHFYRTDLLYKKQLEDGAEVMLAPWYGFDRAGRTGSFGGIPTLAETESHLVGFRSEWRGRLAEPLTAQVGFDFELVHSQSRREGAITSPPREGDPYVFGRAPADQVNADAWKSTIASAAPYVEVDLALFEDKVHVTPGVRFEPYLIDVQRRRPRDPAFPDRGFAQQDITLQPRLALRYSPDPRVTFTGAVGRYRQPPLPDDLSAVFGNPALTVAEAMHFVGGAGYKVLTNLSVETTVFHTRSEGLAARNPAEAPRVAEALLPQGEGRSMGAQFLLRRDKGESPFFGWVAYTLLRSERRDAPGEPFRLFDYDQTHVLTALASYELGSGFEIGGRVRAATGFPRTPVLGAYYDARRGVYEPLLGAHNSDRIPAFLQVDVRASKRFSLEQTELEVYLDVQNVANRENPEEIAYSPDYSERRYIVGLPILPVFGARWSF